MGTRLALRRGVIQSGRSNRLVELILRVAVEHNGTSHRLSQRIRYPHCEVFGDFDRVRLTAPSVDNLKKNPASPPRYRGEALSSLQRSFRVIRLHGIPVLPDQRHGCGPERFEKGEIIERRQGFPFEAKAKHQSRVWLLPHRRGTLPIFGPSS